MVQRCTNPRHPGYGYYGARGITVCERWLHSHEAFREDMGDPLDGYWLDRIDNNKGYEPGNCRWVTPKESAANRRPTGSPPNPNSLRQKSKAAGLNYNLVFNRIQRGWPEGLALTIPAQKRGPMTYAAKKEFGLRWQG